MISDHDLQSITHWLQESHQPVLFSHRRPDGDSLGSLAAMTSALKRQGLAPEATLFEPFPERYNSIKGDITWHIWDDVRDVLERQCDGVILLDTCALTQLEPIGAFLTQCPRTLVIDHHRTRDPIGTRPGDLRIFDETASATGLIVAEWIRSLGVEFDPPLADALFTAIATDCGWFRFPNTDARTLRMIADLVEAGADPARLHNAMYQQEPAAKLRLIAHVLTNMEILADGRLAVLYLRDKDFAATGADRSMTDELVNEAARLGGTEATLLFTEEDATTIRVNLRSKSTLDVSAVASRYGGGGHPRAAGARLRGAWDQVVPRLLEEVVEVL